MALFKMYRGMEARLPVTITDGNVYFCKDTGNYYIDCLIDSTPTRVQISAKYAGKLRYVKDGTTTEIDPATILTDGNYATKIGVASSTKSGLMSAEMADKLSGIATGANKTIVDDAISNTSTNPVQNKVIKEALDAKAGLATATTSANGLMSSADKTKLGNIAAGAEVNQNAYSSVTVGTTAIAATGKTDNITVVAGENVTLTPDASKKQYTISAKDTKYGLASSSADGLMSKTDKAKMDTVAEGANNYVHPTNTAHDSGLYKVTIDEQGHVSDAVEVVKGDITALGIPAQDTTYSAASSSADGLMSAADKAKLDGISANANKYELPTASATTLGGVKIGANIDITDGVISVASADTKMSDTSTNAVQNKVVKTYVDTKVAGLVDSAPETLDTLNELAAALGDDPNFATTIATQIGGKVDKVGGKGLSTNDYTNEDKAKLDGISEGAQPNQNAFSNVVVGSTTIAADTVTDTLTFVAGTNVTITPNEASDTITIEATDTTYAAVVSGSNVPGLMTGADKKKLDGIAENATRVLVDAALNADSTNAIQNKAVKAALDGKSDKTHTHPAYENQNAFGIIKIGAATVEADAAVDTIELEAGDNVTITPNAGAGKIVIAATDTTYTKATTSADGLMAAADKAKLDGINAGAQVNVIEGVTSESLTVGTVTDKKIGLEINWVEF